MISYRDRDPKGWCGDPTRGAAMGRAPVRGQSDFDAVLTVRQIALGSDGYDQCGTYWGAGVPLYWYASDDGEVQGHVRGASVAAAEIEIRNLCPRAQVRPPAEPSPDDVETASAAYIEAMLWLTPAEDAGAEEPSGEFLDADFSPADVSPEARKRIESIVGRFLAEHMGEIGARVHDAGHCLYLDSHGHGAGFNDWPGQNGRSLAKAAAKVGQVYPYVDGGTVRLSGENE